MKHRIPASGIGRGFTLIEVLLAVGVVAIGLLAIVGSIAAILHLHEQNAQRRAILEAGDSLKAYLDDELPFNTVYEWVFDATGGSASDRKEVTFVRFRADADEAARPDSRIDAEAVRTIWFDPTSSIPGLGSPHDIAAYEGAREGYWIKARLSLSPVNPQHPDNGDPNLPQSPDAYQHASLVLLCELDIVPEPTSKLPENIPHQLVIPVLR